MDTTLLGGPFKWSQHCLEARSNGKHRWEARSNGHNIVERPVQMVTTLLGGPFK